MDLMPQFSSTPTGSGTGRPVSVTTRPVTKVGPRIGSGRRLGWREEEPGLGVVVVLGDDDPGDGEVLCP
ncbi:MAG: hypothetical protein HY649_00580 [Acidobacteria bacterium]|nr:hypothetical protein [Acidobacteriota bacterium]